MRGNKFNYHGAGLNHKKGIEALNRGTRCQSTNEFIKDLQIWGPGDNPSQRERHKITFFPVCLFSEPTKGSDVLVQ